MPYLIGTDEAGYGPNLGPLVISASVWRVPAAARDADLYDLLAPVVCRKPQGVGDDRLAIADSKELYKPGGGLAGLERGVLAALQWSGRQVDTWNGIWSTLCGEDATRLARMPWYRDYEVPLPTSLAADEPQRVARQLHAEAESTRVELVALRSAAVFPPQFNQLVDQLDSKGAALTRTTLELVADCLTELDDQPMTIHCDKHGGRNKYLPALQTVFPEYLMEVYREGRELSVYRWGPSHRRCEFRFQAKGERFLPSALASMTSKYLRELAMGAFNQFWQDQVPGLKPTAGYPVDAKRFKQDIQAAQAALNIDDRVLWRCR